jgi:PKD repeat protein
MSIRKMVNNLSKKIIFFVTIIFLINFISAGTFLNGNLSHVIEKTYGPSEDIRGWINISLNNEPTNSILSGSIGNIQNDINLIDLINKSSNSGFYYTCDPLDCNSDYSASTGELSKIFNLNEGASSTIGFKITSSQPITDLSYFSINVTSNNPESTNLPLSVDILNDGQIDWKANVSSTNFSDAQHGCYNVSSTNYFAGIISTKPYCEKVSLSESPAVNISANVIGTGSVMFTMTIQDVNFTSTKTCSVTAAGSGNIGCIPSNFPVSGKDYFVCIKTTNSVDDNKYKLGYEQTDPTCGFAGTYSGNYNYDFNISAQTKKYANIGNLTFNSPNFKNEVKNYISTRYGNNCTNGCIVPINFISGINQQINVTQPSVSYISGVSSTETYLYNLDEIPAKISSGFQKLFVDEANFQVPADYGNYTASLTLDNNPLFSDKISVGASTIEYLTPLETAVEYPTKFTVVINSTKNITAYTWDFGDGNNKTTTTNEIVYSYNESGTYKLTVSTIDSSGGISSQTFSVDILSASEVVPALIQSTENNINGVETQLSNFSEFEQRSIDSVLKLNDTMTIVSNLASSISSATTEADYENILKQLLAINIPQSIETTASSNNVLFYPQSDNINLDILKQITGETYGTEGEDAYRNAILAWNEANADTKITYKELSAIYTDHQKPLLKTFDVTVTKKGDNTDNPYLIIKDLNDLFFSQDYSQQEESGYTYLTLSSQETNFVFSTTDDVDFISLPLFVSPKISDLSVIGGNVTPFQESSQRWITFGIIAGTVVIVGLAIWFFIRMWYKRKYENYLFKNKNNLYNLLNYIDAEKKRGTTEKDIRLKLKKTGWNSEQINYSLKKYSGKK